MGKVDKGKLLHRPRVDDGRVSIPGVGDFRIRPLSRAETLMVHDATENQGKIAGESLLLHLGLTDPPFTMDEIAMWMAEPGSAEEIQPVSNGIAKISGLMPDAGKAAYKSV